MQSIDFGALAVLQKKSSTLHAAGLMTGPKVHSTVLNNKCMFDSVIGIIQLVFGHRRHSFQALHDVCALS